MKSRVKKYGAVILAFAMFATCMTGFSGAKVAEAADTTVTNTDGVKYIKYDGIDKYRTTKDENGYYVQSPKLPGYVFGGWFTDSNETNSIGTATTGAAWAKFVPQKTFIVKAQISNPDGAAIDTTLDGVQTVNLRLVTGVDSLEYKKMIFKVTHLGVTDERVVTRVMDTIDVKDEESDTYEQKSANTFFGNAAEYFATLRYTGIAASTANAERFLQDWTVIPMLVTLDGTLVEGITREELKIQDAVSKKFQTSASNSRLTLDEVSGKATVDLSSNGALQRFYLESADGVYTSTKWEITGAFTNLVGAPMKGFTIYAEDGTAGFYTMYSGGVSLNQNWGYPVGGGWNTKSSDNQNIWATSRYNTGIGAVGDYVRFKLVVADDVFSLWIDDELIWQLPLTSADFGTYVGTQKGFTAGSSYRIGLQCLDVGTKMEWTDLRVKCGEDVDSYKFLVDSMPSGMTADTTDGKVTVDLTSNGGVHEAWLGAADGTSSSTSWEIRGTFKQLISVMKGFSIQSADGTKNGFYTFWTGGVSLNQRWGSPVSGGWDIYNADQKYVFTNADYNGLDANNVAKKFKVLIQDDIFSFLVEDKLVWQLPLTNARFGGFDAGTSYRFALRCLDVNGQAEWSDLTVKCGAAAGEQKFLVTTIPNGMTPDTIDGKVTVDMTQDSSVKHLKFGTADGTNTSTSWEITGTFKQIKSIMKGFTIQSADGTKTGFYTFWTNGISLNQNWGYPVGGGWNIHNADEVNIFTNADYNALGTNGVAKKFKAVIQNDVFSFWVEDKLVWQLPLTDATYGGFDAGTSYSFMIRHLDPGQAEWSDLTVQYGEE